MYTFSTCNQSSLTFTFLELLSEIFSVLTVRRKPSWNMEANKLRLMNHLVEMIKSLVADRVKDKQDMAYVEEKGREILTLRRRGNRVIMSGDNIRLRKVQNADPIITDYLRSLFGEEDDGNELRFETDEDTENPNKFIPKLFCQVGDKKNGWHSKTVERYATLLLTILSGGQGGKLSISDKSAPKPAWFCGNWSTFINPTSAHIEANTDVILGIFKYFDLDPKLHNLLPVHEEGEPGEVGPRAGVAENKELGAVNEAGGGQVQLNQEEVNLETMPVVTEENVNLETIPEAADQNVELETIPVAAVSENLEEVIENQHPKEKDNSQENAMEIDVIVDDMGEKEVEEEEMETSLNLNISSVSDTPEEESSHGEKSGKKKFNLFVKPGKDTVVQAIKPRLDTEKFKKCRSKKQVKEKKTQNKKVNETKSKRKTKLPAKFLDGIDSKEVLQRTVMIQIG